MRTYWKISMLLAICICIFAGCGQKVEMPQEVQETSLSINEEGGISLILVGDFEKDYYNTSELKEMATEEAAAYNVEHQAQGQALVSVVEANILVSNPKKVQITTSYLNADIYADYYGSILFYGTVQEAKTAGYDMNVTLTNEKGNSLQLQDSLNSEKTSSKMLVITNEKLDIYPPTKADYVSEKVVFNDDGSADTTAVEGTAYILLK